MDAVDLVDADALASFLSVAPPTAGLLDQVDPERLSASGRDDYLAASLRHVRHAQAHLMRALGEKAAQCPGDPDGVTLAEVTAATNWAPSVARDCLRQGETLVHDLPSTLEALSDGRISIEQATALCDLTQDVLDEGAVREIEARVLPLMPGRGAADTRAEIMRAVQEVDPYAGDRRHHRKRERRHVRVRPELDGMATLSAYLPTEDALAIHDKLTDTAKNHQRTHPEETRPLDALRADALTGFVLGGGGADGVESGAKLKPEVLVVAELDTLLGLNERCAEIDGAGPIGAEQARQMAWDADARWRLLVLDAKGVAIAASWWRYEPGAALRRIVRLIYRTCAYPGCRVRAEDCEIDHLISFGKGGFTLLENLAPLCKHHHQLKTKGYIKVRKLGDYNLEWTLQCGATYITKPKPYFPLRT
jgi:hypothetical protein